MSKNGSLKNNYNAVKPSKRQVKKLKQEETNLIKQQMMINFLENKWKNDITFSCSHCLEEAYNSILNNEIGYITDEELITSSNNILQHK